jgi:hypothetical protein
MIFDPIVEEFFEAKPELLQEIKGFEQRRNLKLLKKLIADRDEINFFSWLSEVHFGLFFDNISTEIKNDHCIEGKTPDWTIWVNGQKILAEVLRLNTPEEEYRESIAKNRQLRRFQKENPGVPLIIPGPVKTISLQFLGGSQSKLVQKEEKYRNLIHKHQLPLILCVSPTLETFLFELDFADFLLGSKGFFNCDVNFGRNVTGVLLNTPFGRFFYYHNTHAACQLLQENVELLSPFSYPV